MLTLLVFCIYIFLCYICVCIFHRLCRYLHFLEKFFLVCACPRDFDDSSWIWSWNVFFETQQWPWKWYRQWLKRASNSTNIQKLQSPPNPQAFNYSLHSSFARYVCINSAPHKNRFHQASQHFPYFSQYAHSCF